MNKATGKHTRAIKHLIFLFTGYSYMAQGSKFWGNKFVEVRQPEIDHIREHGRPPQLGVWDSLAQWVKYNGTEFMNDSFNDTLYEGVSDPDKFRAEAYNQAKMNAEDDYRSRTNPDNILKKPYQSGDPEEWIELKSGKYRGK